MLRRVADVLRDSKAPQDPTLVAAASSGELLVAIVRLVVFSAVLVIFFVPGFDGGVFAIGLTLNLVALLWGVVVLVVVVRSYRPWMGYVSSLGDVSLVTAAMVAFLITDRPEVVVSSKVLFEIYFLAIGFCALRYDWRVCAAAGALATVQFLAVVTYAQASWDLSVPRSDEYGVFSWGIQAARVILLLTSGFLATLIVLRGQHLRSLSNTDSLTGIRNRGYFDERLSQELRRAHRYKRRLTVAILDIDRFKLFNDTHGHSMGDQVLRNVAQTITRSVRATDVAARYGGDEFAMLFPENAPDSVLPTLETLRADLANEGSSGPGEIDGITISVGVAGYPEDGDFASRLMEVADDRLYEAKHAGRNRVVSKTEPTLRARRNR